MGEEKVCAPPPRVEEPVRYVVVRPREGADRSVTRRRALLVAGPVLVALLGVLALSASPSERSEPRGLSVSPSERSESRPPRVVLERPASDVSLVARELSIPVSVVLGEKLVVVKRETGYTHVLLERAGQPSETRMVAEPGDPIEVRAGGQAIETQPGESISIEKGEGELVRIAVIGGVSRGGGTSRAR